MDSHIASSRALAALAYIDPAYIIVMDTSSWRIVILWWGPGHIYATFSAFHSSLASIRPPQETNRSFFLPPARHTYMYIALYFTPGLCYKKHGSYLALGHENMPNGASISPGVRNIQPSYEFV